MINNVRKHLGLFNSLEEATTARRIASTVAFGEFLNTCEEELDESEDDDNNTHFDSETF